MTGYKYCRVLSSNDITRSNISTYCIYHHRNWGRTSIRGRTNRSHHMPRPDGRAMGCLSWIIWGNWSRYNGTALYILLWIRARNTRVCETATFCSGFHHRGTSMISIADHLWGESTDYRRTPPTNGQQRRKHLHNLTCSWYILTGVTYRWQAANTVEYCLVPI